MFLRTIVFFAYLSIFIFTFGCEGTVIINEPEDTARDFYDEIPSDEDSELPLDSLSKCAEGTIASDCRCGDVGKKSGFCCTELWFDSQYSSCPSGTRYYVAPDGSDSNNGLSKGSPFKTFYKPMTIAKEGDVILAMPGTYTEENSVTHNAAYHSEPPNIMIPLTEELANGSAQQPITIRGLRNESGYPPVLEFQPTDLSTGETIGKIGAYVSGRHHWIIDGLEFYRSGIWVWGGNSEGAGNTHDIRIQRNIVHHVVAEGGGNPGLIKVDRADVGGSYNITIKENLLYQMSDRESPYVWLGMGGAVDTQHHGAVTFMSLCPYKYSKQHYPDSIDLATTTLTYEEVAADCTGRVDIVRNHITQVPQMVYSKNSMIGPINIVGNTVHDTDSIFEVLNGSNINLVDNLMYDIGGMGTAGDEDSPGTVEAWINANNFYVAYNTILFDMRRGEGGLLNHVFGSGHLFEYNVFFNMGGPADEKAYGTASYLRQSQYLSDPDDISKSQLHGIESNNNCFISKYENPMFIRQSTVSGWIYYDHRKALETFGFDPDSEFYKGKNPADFFAQDYAMLDSEKCRGKGVHSYPFNDM